MDNIIIIGYGGSGQTFFMKHIINKLKIKINRLNDSDKIKHISYPNELFNEYINNINKKIKVIFVINDTFTSVCSHFRRKWAQVQIDKLNNIYNINLKNKNITSIEDYLQNVEKHNIDYFGFINQVKSWKDYDGPIYFHNFNNPNYKELLNFIELEYTNLNIEKIKYNIIENNKYEYLKLKYKNAYNFYNNLNQIILEEISNH